MAALSSFIVRRNDRYAHGCTDRAAVTTKNNVALCGFCGQSMAALDIHKEMLPTCGEQCLSRQTVHNWVQKFLEGRTSIQDERRVSQPVEIAMPAKNFTLQVSGDL
jgi:hypothetical protein